MANNFGNLDYSQLKDWQNKLNSLTSPDEFVDRCAKEIAARLLEKVTERTPTGDYREGIEYTAKRSSKYHKKGDVYLKYGKNLSGRHGGTLKREWTIGQIKRMGNTVYIEVLNPTEYASYVEYGHRQTPGRYVPAIGKKLKKSWVNGKFMLKISSEEVQKLTPALLEERIRDYFKELR